LIPIFSDQVPDVEIFLQTTSIPIATNLTLTGLTIQLDTTPLSISVGTGLDITFSDNPELEFDVKGTLNTDGSVLLAGDMLGSWENMFGIKGFDISNVDIEVGFNPSMCGVDLCLSDVGLGFNLSIGSSSIGFYGNVAVPDIEDIFIEGSISGPNGMALSFCDIATEWNEIVGDELGIPINVSDIPCDWGILDTSFYIAPESGTFNQVTYQQGFWIDGGFDLFGVDCDVEIEVTSKDFIFEIHVNVSEFEQELWNELGVRNNNENDDPIVRFVQRSQNPVMNKKIQNMKTAFSIVKVYNVTLDNWSVANIAEGLNPNFTMEYDFLGHQIFNCQLPIEELWDGFHNL